MHHSRQLWGNTPSPTRRKIRLIEGNAKCRHLKNGLERDFASARFLTKAPSLTVHKYIYLFTQGRGEDIGESERRGEGQHGKVQITKLGRRYQHD
jgi:hypothetical protein